MANMSSVLTPNLIIARVNPGTHMPQPMPVRAGLAIHTPTAPLGSIGVSEPAPPYIPPAPPSYDITMQMGKLQ